MLKNTNTQMIRDTDKQYTATRHAWRDMHNCCKNPNNPRYKDYGSRGMAVCKEWNNFENFLHDMGEKPQGLSLERRDNNKGYFPDNCKWATPMEQSNNTRRNMSIPEDFPKYNEILKLFEVEE